MFGKAARHGCVVCAACALLTPRENGTPASVRGSRFGVSGLTGRVLTAHRDNPLGLLTILVFLLTNPAPLGHQPPTAVTGHGVGVTLVAPGGMETGFWDNLGGLPERPMLTAMQVAESIVWAIGQPSGVDLNKQVVRPHGQPV